MKKEKFDIENTLKSYFPGEIKIEKIIGEASQRDFFRIFSRSASYVAMVYPAYALKEIERIKKLSALYSENGLKTPDIFDVLTDRIIIFEDIGEISLQYRYINGNYSERNSIIRDIAKILSKIGSITTKLKLNNLNSEKMKYELIFFVDHFVKNFYPHISNFGKIVDELNAIVSKTGKEAVFAHRDFHSRNIFFHKNEFFLIDFQDSLYAPLYYDLVSIAFDSYLSLEKREYLIDCFSDLTGPIDMDSLYFTALQRNLKALGTFGFQIYSRGNRMYEKFIIRTVKNILGNPKIVNYNNIKKILENFSG